MGLCGGANLTVDHCLSVCVCVTAPLMCGPKYKSLQMSV